MYMCLIEREEVSGLGEIKVSKIVSILAYMNSLVEKTEIKKKNNKQNAQELLSVT